MNLNKNNSGLIVLLITGLIILSIISLIVGKANFPFWKAFEGGKINDVYRLILLEIRFPRTFIAIICGGGLALTGAVLQGYLRNPLADSGVLGISSFSSLGAIIAIYFSLTSISFWILPILAICFAILSILILLAMAGRDNSTIVFILSGVVLSALAGGLLSLILTLSPNPYAISEIYDWQVGSLSNVSLREIMVASPFIFIGSLMLFKSGKKLDALVFGEETAQSLGLNVAKFRINMTIGVGLVIGAITAICGVLAFVGLIVPHLIRPLVGNQPSKTLIPSFLFGALFTLAADIVARILWFDNELRLGVILTLLGAPFFFALLIRMKGQGGQI